MDAFEALVAEIFWKEGFWVQTSFKIDLTKEQKRNLGNPSMPRPEIDVLAYSGRDNVLKIIECKSYLDSRGVTFDSLQLDGNGNRFKLFKNERLRHLVFDCLREQLVGRGACRSDTKMILCLACGRIASDKNRNDLKSYFARQGWELFDEDWLRQRVRSMAAVGYENQIATVVAKLLVREQSLPTSKEH